MHNLLLRVRSESLLFFGEKSKGDTEIKGRSIARRDVEARRVNVPARFRVNADWRVGSQARFVILLRFVIGFVQDVINREIYVHPFFEAF